MEEIRRIIQYREFLKTSVQKDIRGKYKGSFFGVLWSFINPLLQAVVYAVIFPYIMRTQIENYLVYLIIGIIAWTFFTNVINAGMMVIQMNAGIIKKVYFPRIILPLSSAISGVVNFLISCLVILLFCIFNPSIGVSWHIIILPLITFIQFVLSLGISLALSAINIYIKDTQYIIQFVLNLMFYATPILYTVDIFPESLRWVLMLNPMAGLVDAYRCIFMYHTIPDFSVLAYTCVVSVVLFVIGLIVFRKLEKGFAEEV